MIGFWILAAMMTLAVVMILAVPLFETRKLKDESGFALNVYRDQLAEIERDQQRGVLPEDQARAARLEIQRRILALADTPAVQPGRSRRHRRLIAAAAVLLPLFGVVLYLTVGAPQLPGQPFAARQAALPPATPELLALRQHVASHPDDAEAWLALARLALDQQRLQESLDGFSRVLALGKTAPDIYADYGRALILFHDGDVSDDTKAVFQKALALDPKEPTARFFLALAKAQQGDLAGALTDWLALEKESPANAPYRQSLSENIDKAARQLGKDPATLPGREPGHQGGAAPADDAAAPDASTGASSGTAGGPSAQDMQQATQMSPQERAAFIQSMVDRLAERLKQQPDDLEGWLKLARAYSVLNRSDEARQAWSKAAALAPDKLDVQLDYANALIAGQSNLDHDLPAEFAITVSRIRQMAPDNPLGLYYGGLVARAGGRTDEARQLWQRVLALLPVGSDQRAAMQREIDGLGKAPAQ
ncbi:MAG TPA: c-type cytochrome biogenesis protein CcmI [Terriglobia bacterium]|nr:c-type cytochrome biogenesis protein CcmI [Terriglobia bacterium]